MPIGTGTSFYFAKATYRVRSMVHSSTEASLALLVGADGPQEVDLAELGPVHVCEVEFAIGALPQQEPRETDLSACSNDQVRIGKASGIKVSADGLRRDLIDDMFKLLALLNLGPKQRLEGIDNFVPSAIGDCDRQDHRIIGLRGLLGGADRLKDRFRKEVELADRPDLDTSPVNLGIIDELAEFALDCGENS